MHRPSVKTSVFQHSLKETLSHYLLQTVLLNLVNSLSRARVRRVHFERHLDLTSMARYYMRQKLSPDSAVNLFEQPSSKYFSHLRVIVFQGDMDAVA